MCKIAFFACLALASCAPALAQAPAEPQERWPREIESGGTHFLIYQPQADQWNDNRLEARSAVIVTQPGQTKPAYGIVSLSARTEVDKETRMVRLEDVKLTSASFPAAASGEAYLADVIRQSLPDWPRTVSLDRLLADLAITQTGVRAESVQLKNTPPRIIFSNVRSVLILIDGEPVFRPVEGTHYTRVINTPALLLFDPDANRFYLDGIQWWMTATSLTGTWSVAAAPADLEQVKAQLLAGEERDPQAFAQSMPQTPPASVYVSTTPTELIEIRGEPQYSPVAKTQLVYVTNTDRDLFMDIKGQMFYLLLSGRWFEAKTLEGPWSFVPGEKLPRDFAMIPPDSPKGYVLASVPGTPQAREAVIANQVPQTAAVKRSEAKLEVRYDGEPRFASITGTSMDYAVNTDTEVIQAEGRYWACKNAVWFVSDSPAGPWQVADYIPAEIYKIPPTSPLFHLRYVYLYGCNADYAYFGYTPGYLGAFVSDGVVVYGTGWWYYPGWYGDFWFGWPWTYGFGFNFSYWGGGWFWRPVGWYWWYHNPWFMHRIYSEHWNQHWRPGYRSWIRNNVNVYNRWPQNAVATRAYLPRTAAPVRPPVGLERRGDIYAGRDGQVYQRRTEGWYQQGQGGAWRRVTPNPQLQQQHQSRTLGQMRSDEFRRSGQAPGIPRTAAPPRSAGPPPHIAPPPAAAPGRHR